MQEHKCENDDDDVIGVVDAFNRVLLMKVLGFDRATAAFASSTGGLTPKFSASSSVRSRESFATLSAILFHTSFHTLASLFSLLTSSQSSVVVSRT